jgi:hypothetical protein
MHVEDLGTLLLTLQKYFRAVCFYKENLLGMATILTIPFLVYLQNKKRASISAQAERSSGLILFNLPNPLFGLHYAGL